MTTDDILYASIASALVAANLSFTTVVEKKPDGVDARTFLLPYIIRGHDCTLTGFVGGLTFTVLAAVRLKGPPGELTARRHELLDFLVKHQPLVRLFPHPYEDPPGDLDVVWVEVSVPVPPNGQPIDQWLAIVPVGAVLGAVELLASTFKDAEPTTAASFPMHVAARSERQLQTLPKT
jgi:hypothetical protein